LITYLGRIKRRSKKGKRHIKRRKRQTKPSGSSGRRRLQLWIMASWIIRLFPSLDSFFTHGQLDSARSHSIGCHEK